MNEVSFFEMTTSRICEDVNGFHNVTFGPGGNAPINVNPVGGRVGARGGDFMPETIPLSGF